MDERKRIEYKAKQMLNNRRHAEIRLEQRLQMTITTKDLVSIAKMIDDELPNVRIEKTVMQAVKHVRMSYKGHDIKVIYAPKEKKVITAYPINKGE